MLRLINIGFGNMVAADRIIAIASPDSAPVKRLIQDAREGTGWWTAHRAAAPAPSFKRTAII